MSRGRPLSGVGGAPALAVTSVRTARDYACARATIDALIDEIGDDEDHPLADVLDYLGDRVKAYEDARVEIPAAEPREVLRFLMEQHGLRQDDLADCAPQGASPTSLPAAAQSARR